MWIFCFSQEQNLQLLPHIPHIPYQYFMNHKFNMKNGRYTCYGSNDYSDLSS